MNSPLFNNLKFKQMKNKRVQVHILPTERESNIVLSTTNKNIYHVSSPKSNSELMGATNQHLYFTVDEKPKEGDYIIDDNGVFGPWEKGDIMLGKNKGVIIATDDTKLNLPQPSQSFIKKYCEAGGIDKVDVEYELKPIPKGVPMEYGTLLDANNPLNHRLKINSHNEITIHPIKSSWTREEVIAFGLECIQAAKDVDNQDDSSIIIIDEYWIKENL